MLNYYIGMTQKQEVFTLLGGKVKMRRGLYNPTSDAVWLAAFAPTKAKTALDVGIGTGGVSLCMLAHNPGISITGLDISQEMLSLCTDNIQLNNANISLLQENILNWKTQETFDIVITNPPYFQGTPAKHNAHHNADLKKWVQKCIARVKPGGYFCTIVDAKVCHKIIIEMGHVFGDITILPLFGSKDFAERVLIRGRLGSRGGTLIYRGLQMNYEPVLRDGLTIDSVLSRLNKI